MLKICPATLQQHSYFLKSVNKGKSWDERINCPKFFIEFIVDFRSKKIYPTTVPPFNIKCIYPRYFCDWGLAPPSRRNTSLFYVQTNHSSMTENKSFSSWHNMSHERLDHLRRWFNFSNLSTNILRFDTCFLVTQNC